MFEEDEFSGGVGVLERPREDTEIDPDDLDDAELYSHYVDDEKFLKAKVSGRAVVALCGKVWHPKKDPEKYPVCPKCVELYEEYAKRGKAFL